MWLFKMYVKGEGDDTRFAHEELRDDTAGWEGWAAKEGPHLAALGCAVYTAAQKIVQIWAR